MPPKKGSGRGFELLKGRGPGTGLMEPLPPLELVLVEEPPLHVRRLMDTLGVTVVIEPGAPVQPGLYRDALVRTPR